MNPLQRLIIAALLLLASGLATAGEVTLYYHLDALGSPVAATDEQGNVKWREEYKPYGERINQEATAQANRRWYTGHPHDEATGLTYMGARYYDPVIGRFMAVDSVSFQEQNAINTFNRYAYAANSPYRYVDKDGKCYSSGDIESYMGPDLLDCYVGEGGELLSLGTGVSGAARLAAGAGKGLVKVLGREAGEVLAGGLDDLFKNGRTAKASEIKTWAEQQGWALKKNPKGPLKYVDDNGHTRITIKQGSPRTPGSDKPHVEIRDAGGQRVDPYGNPVTKRSPGNHTPIDWDL